MDTQVTFNVYQSMDYDKFRILNGNRPISQARVDKIAESMKANGVFELPILVDKEFHIIDGQHRFYAFKKLGLPVYYIMREMKDPKECAVINSTSKKWSQLDYINFYANNGLTEYQKLQKLILKFKKDIVYSNLLVCIINSGMRDSWNKELKEGKITLKEPIEVIENRIKVIIDLCSFCKKPNREYVVCFLTLLRFNIVDYQRLYVQLKKKGQDYCLAATCVDEVLMNIEKVYNFGYAHKTDLLSQYRAKNNEQ